MDAFEVRIKVIPKMSRMVVSAPAEMGSDQVAAYLAVISIHLAAQYKNANGLKLLEVIRA